MPGTNPCGADLGSKIPRSERACKPEIMKLHCVGLGVSQTKLENALPTLLWTGDSLGSAGGRNLKQEQNRSPSNP